MTPLDIFLIIAALGVAILVAVLVPLLTQLRQTTAKADLLIDSLNRDLEPLIGNLNEAAGEIKTLAASLNDKAARTDAIIDTLEEAADTVLSTTRLLKSTATPLLSQVGAINAGVRAFLQFFAK